MPQPSSQLVRSRGPLARPAPARLAGTSFQGEASFSPASLAGLLIWLKADGINYQDSARTILAIADADPIGSLTDYSGQNNHASQSVAGQRPSLKLAIQNGLPAIRPDGVDDFLSLAAALSPNACTVFIVFKPAATITSATTFQAVLGQTGATTGGLIGLGNLTGALTAEVVSFTSNPGGGAQGVCSTPNLSGWHVHSFGLSGASDQIYLDGAAQSVNVSSNGHMDSATTARFLLVNAIGKYNTGNYAAQDWGEILIYNSALSASDQQSVEAYLKARWGTP